MCQYVRSGHFVYVVLSRFRNQNMTSMAGQLQCNCVSVIVCEYNMRVLCKYDVMQLLPCMHLAGTDQNHQWIHLDGLIPLADGSLQSWTRFPMTLAPRNQLTITINFAWSPTASDALSFSKVQNLICTQTTLQSLGSFPAAYGDLNNL